MEKSILSKMRIIRVCTHLNYGGIERKMINLSSYDDKINEWIYVSLGIGGEAEKLILSNGKAVFCLNSKVKIFNFLTFFKLFRLVYRIKPNVIHSAGGEANFYSFLVGKLLFVPRIIVEEIGIPQHSFVAVKVFSYIYRNSYMVIGESKAVINNILKKYTVSKNKLKIIPNFIILNCNFNVNKLLNRDIFTFLTISRLEEVKNIQLQIKLIKSLLDEGYNVKLVIVGDGSQFGYLQKLTIDLSIEKNVIFEGYRSNVNDYYQNADLFLLTSFSEGFSNSLLEAMSNKLPCITTRVGSAEEIIIEGYNGWIVNVDDFLDILQKVKYVLSYNKNELTIVGENAYQHLLKNFSINTHISNLLELYRS